MSGERYGAKCFRCAHILHDGPCSECSFCKHGELLELAMKQGGMDLFGPEIKEAVAAFHSGQDHPLLETLRIECSMLGTTIDAGGRRWFVADAQFDACENEVGSHLHLTLTEVIEASVAAPDPVPVPYEGDKP